MNLYNMLFGTHPLASVLLCSLNLAGSAVPRVRDCMPSDEAREIVILTRTGGGNRDFYDNPEQHKRAHPDSGYEGPWNSDLRSHPCYLRDDDDDFDSTYARFYFSVPPAFEPMLTVLNDHLRRRANPRDMRDALVALTFAEDDESKRAAALRESLVVAFHEQHGV